VANELHSVLINARSEQEKLERAVESAVEREQNLKIQVDALNGLLERMTLRVDVLERADKQWQEKYEELVENTRQERADMDRLVEECAEFRELAARARAAYAPGGEISVMRDRVRALELELKDAQQLAKSMRLQAEQTAAQMKAIREDRDDLRTRCAVQDQAIKVMSAQLKDDSDEDDSQPDADAKGDADDAESQHSDSTEASNEDASSKKEDGETKSEKSGSDDSGDDDDDEVCTPSFTLC
jgi:chromosome segregation ATPase